MRSSQIQVNASGAQKPRSGPAYKKHMHYIVHMFVGERCRVPLSGTHLGFVVFGVERVHEVCAKVPLLVVGERLHTSVSIIGRPGVSRTYAFGR
jgi:hypothetical protein